MIKMKYKIKPIFAFLSLIVFLILIVSVSAYKVDPTIEEELEDKEEVSVVVMLKDEPDFTTKANELKGSGKETKIPSRLERKKLMIKNQQDKVFSKLNLKNEKTKTLLTQETDDVNLTQETDNFELKLKHRYSTVNGFSGEITKEALEKLKQDPDVERIYLDVDWHGNLDESVPEIGADSVWRLQLNDTNITGKGETICVLDTGIDTDHTAFSGRILDQYCYCSTCPDGTTEDDSAEDDQGHGTHVTGIAAGNHSTYRGVAPDAGIIAIKVLNSASPPAGTTSNIIAGIDWCTNNASKYNISVISMSLGGGGPFNSYCDSISVFTSAINSAVGVNISVTVASGNIAWTNGIAQPACVENATPVGASYRLIGGGNPESITYSRGNILELIAPGGNAITAPYMGGGTKSISGTSMSTPHVAGSIALLHQFTRLWNNTRLTPQQAEDLLNETGVRISDTVNIAEDDANYGRYYSRIDVFKAIVSLDNFAPNVTFVNPTPQNTTTPNGSIFINVTVNDTLNVDSCVLEWNYTNQSMNKSGSGKSVSCYLNKSINNNGTYYYKVYANDSNNNFNFTELRYVNATNITNTAPEAQNVAITSTDNLDRTNGSLSGSWDFYDFNDHPQLDNETKWYNNSIEVTSLANLTEIGSGNTTKNQNWTFSVRVSDGSWSAWVNSTNLTIVDATPLLNNSIPNQTWYMNTNISLNLSEYFIDIDRDNLTFDVLPINSTNSSPTVNITAVVNGSNITLIPDTNWAGTNTIRFNATDGSSITLSNIINLTVTADLDGDSYNSTTYGGTDCDDGNAAVNPGATEACSNSVDDDCDGSTDEGCNGGTPSSGGGGGGGGGGAVSISATETSKFFAALSEGYHANMYIKKPEVAFSGISFKVNKQLRMVKVIVKKIEEENISVKIKNQKVYQYLEIKTENITDNDLSSADIEFRVKKKWLVNNSVNSEDIALFRFKNGWSELSSEKTKDDETYVYYKATTPGFSYFVVSLKGAKEELPEEEPVIEEEIEEEEEKDIKEKIKEERYSPKRMLIGLGIILIIVIVGIMIIYKMRTKGTKRSNWIEDEIRIIAKHMHLGNSKHVIRRYKKLRKRYDLFPDKDKRKHYHKIKELHDKISSKH